MKTKAYRVEWMHNYQWRMEWSDKLTFKTRAQAEKEIKKPSFANLKTRIVVIERTVQS